MDRRPIGVFDSGLGGLTMVKALTRLLPHEDIIYLGDTGRVPYGPRSRETIIKYARQDAQFLASFDIKAMVVACNTVCSVALDDLKKAHNLPIYEVVKTPANAAALKTKNKKVGVIGTAATIGSGAYEKALHELDPGIDVYSAPCPLLVPLVEEGWTQPGNIAVEYIVSHYTGTIREKQIDTLILGCTHYSLLTDVISKIVGESVALIDSGTETAKLVASDLTQREMLRGGGTEAAIKYYVTDSVADFSKHAAKFLESDVRGMVKQVNLLTGKPVDG